MKLINYADGIKGHYCIGRKVIPGQPWWEYYAYGDWYSCGQVFIGKFRAMQILKKLRKQNANR